jgi:hypothetical protein
MFIDEEILKEIARLREDNRNTKDNLDAEDSDNIIRLSELNGYAQCLEELELFIRGL